MEMSARPEQSFEVDALGSIASELQKMRPFYAAGICRSLLAALGILAMLFSASIPATAAQEATRLQSGTIRIQGRVINSSGSPVSDAQVRIEQEGVLGALETVTDAVGAFAFSESKSGNYSLIANKSGLCGRAAVIVPPSGEVEMISLVLAVSGECSMARAKSADSPTQTMEFADKPTFTVAGVMDWTAAGGHGSDSSLRTSEALTRETLTLKPDGAGSSAANLADDKGVSNEADVHRQVGELAEKRGDPLAAVHEYEQAVHLNPSEQNYFEWGSELLLHRAVSQAQEVFQKGAEAYPKSVRMLTALGTALFAGARYDEAALRLCEASDLNPADPEPYIFMGKIEVAAPSSLLCIEPKLARFAEQQPSNPLANYFYAMAIWKKQVQAQPSGQQSLQQVETLLKKAVTLDANYADAYLQLGILHYAQRDFEKAIGFYIRAITANPELADAYYRLAVAYDRIGEREKAKQEFQLHDEIRKRQAAAIELQRKEVKQFLVSGQPTYPAANR
jgi:tetratricopeptide (TPR) repeat protein